MTCLSFTSAVRSGGSEFDLNQREIRVGGPRADFQHPVTGGVEVVLRINLTMIFR